MVARSLTPGEYSTSAPAFSKACSRRMVSSRSLRPRLLARPRLVVASASKPSEASSFAVPASQGLGMMKTPGRLCRARNAVPFSAWVRMTSDLLEVGALVDGQALELAAQTVEG